VRLAHGLVAGKAGGCETAQIRFNVVGNLPAEGAPVREAARVRIADGGEACDGGHGVGTAGCARGMGVILFLFARRSGLLWP